VRERRHRPWKLALGLGRDRQPRRRLDHWGYNTATDHKVRIEDMAPGISSTAPELDGGGSADGATALGVSGTALPRRLYIAPELRGPEQELIFGRTWQLAGHVGTIPRPGSYLTASAGVEPVLVIRDEEGQLRAYRNVCRHRGSRLLSGSGQ